MRQMTPKQRLLTTIAHQEPDRVPISPRMMLWVDENYGPMNWLQALKLQAEFDMDPRIDIDFNLPAYIRNPFSGDYRDLPGVSVDISVENDGEVNIMRRRFRTPAGELTDCIALAHPLGRYGRSPSPTHREHLVKGPEDVEKIQFLFPDPNTVRGTNWPEIMEIIGERGLLQVHPAAGVGTAIMTTAMGISNAMLAYYDDRQMFDRLLQICADHFQKVTKRIMELGAPLLFVSWHDFGVSAGWSPKIWRDAFKPVIKANVDLVHSYGGLYHYFDNGPMAAILPDLAEIGVDIVSTLCPPKVGDVDLAKAKQQIGHKVTLAGNVDAIWVIQRGTPEQVREAVRENIRVAAPGGGYILDVSDCIMPGTPRENVEAFFQAAHEFGRYPINLS